MITEMAALTVEIDRGRLRKDDPVQERQINALSGQIGNYTSVPDVTGLPAAPQGYHLMVEMVEAKKKIGSIHVPEERKRLEDTASPIAKVLAMGPDAYQDKQKFPSGPWCKVGDNILMRSYSGTRIKFGQRDIRFINDDSVEAVVIDPESIERGY